MIRMALPVHPELGYVIDLQCPAIVCDHCGRPIDSDAIGVVLWDPSGPQPARHAHKGGCDRALDPNRFLLWVDVDVWLDQLRRNYYEPVIGATVHLNDGTEVGPIREIVLRGA